MPKRGLKLILAGVSPIFPLAALVKAMYIFSNFLSVIIGYTEQRRGSKWNIKRTPS